MGWARLFLVLPVLAASQNATGKMWTVSRGLCQVDENDCLSSPHWPEYYSVRQICTVEVTPGNTVAISVVRFSTEQKYDYLEVNGVQYSGIAGPQSVVPTGIVRWYSDFSIVSAGWKICPYKAPASACDESLEGDGQAYRGCQNMTKSGKVCQAWSSQSPNAQPYDPKSNKACCDLTENYCRNPAGADRSSIWCYLAQKTSEGEANWDYCEPIQAYWEVLEGPCTAVGNCLRSGNYPSSYSTNEYCSIEVGKAAGENSVLQVNSFDTEYGYDVMAIAGLFYSGTRGPDGVSAKGQVTWNSDYSNERSGWEICIVEATTTTVTTLTTTAKRTTSRAPSPAPSPATSTTITTGTTTGTSVTITTTATTATTATTTTVVTSTSTSTTEIPTVSVAGTLALTVGSDAATAVAQLQTSNGTAALKQGIVDLLNDVTTDMVSITDIFVQSSSGGRRLQSGGIVGIEYFLLVLASSGISDATMDSSGSLFTSNINQALIAFSQPLTVQSVQNSRKTTITLTTTTLTTSLTRTKTVTSTVTTTSTTTTSVTTTSSTMVPIDCVWDAWQAWGECSAPCGGGNRTREHLVLVKPQYGGLTCPGGYFDTGSCNIAACTDCDVGFYLVIVSNTQFRCDACGSGRYNPTAGATSPSACLFCPAGTSSMAGESSCSPCDPGMAASRKLVSVLSAQDGTLSGNFVAVSNYVELPGPSNIACGATTCTGLISFNAYCQVATNVYLTAVVIAPDTQSDSFLIEVSSSTNTFLWNTGVWASWKQSANSPQFTLGVGEQSVRLKASEDGIKVRSVELHYVQSSSAVCGLFKDVDEWVCDKCSPGTQAAAPGMTACEDCFAGRYQSNWGSEECALCKAGTFSTTTGSSDFAVCQDCPKGTASNTSGASVANMCAACNPGRFGTASGAQFCEGCGMGLYGVLSGQTSAASCQKCQSGRYNDLLGSSECMRCAPGTFFGGSGADRSSDCLRCQLGKYSEGAASCSLCNAGSYAPQLGLALCPGCEPGRFSPTPGASNCSDCPVGRYANLTGTTSCDVCPSGRYGLVRGSLSEDSCTFCPAGTASSATGASDNGTCTPCVSGQFSGPGQSSCFLCSPGRFSDTSRASECSLCAAGQIASAPSSSMCWDCQPGSYSDASATSCLYCGSGRYNPSTASPDNSSCVRCPAGRASQTAGLIAMNQCRICAAGQFSQAGDVTCSYCVAGTSSWAGNSSCTACAKGTYNKITGTSACSLCPVGTFNDQDELPTTACTFCKAGTYRGEVGGSSASDCRQCSLGTFSAVDGESACDLCPKGSIASSVGLSECAGCPGGSVTPYGAFACCPGHSGHWTVSPAGSLNTPPGKSKTAIQLLTSATNCDDIGDGKFLIIDHVGLNTSLSKVQLVTLDKTSMFSCVELACDDQEFCELRLDTGKDIFSTGEGFTVTALVTSLDSKGDTVQQACSAVAEVLFSGFGCAPDTLQYFLLALTSVVAITVLLGLCLEQFHKARLSILIECSFDMRVKVPIYKTPLGVREGGHHSNLEGVPDGEELEPTGTDELVLEELCIDDIEELPIRGPTTGMIVSLDDPLPEVKSIDSAFSSVTPLGSSLGRRSPGGRSPGPRFAGDSPVDIASLAGPDPASASSALAAAKQASQPMEVRERRREAGGHALALPTKAMLKEAVGRELEIPEKQLPNFAAWLVKDSKGDMETHTVHVEFSVKAPRGRHLELRQKLAQSSWRPAACLPAPWDKTIMEQQPPALIKARMRAPGLDLLDLLERASAVFSGGVENEDRDSRSLHLSVGRAVLARLTSRKARVLLGLQYFCNLLASALLPYLGYLRMNSCEEGFPQEIHFAWLGYMAITSSISVALLRYSLGGKDAAAFCHRFKGRLFFRIVCSFIMLTDTYQDATFPVIANKCNFDLWFVSAWLCVLGVGVMQVMSQLLVLLVCAIRYRLAQTPEERERLLVQGAFMALRGSDNLVLVYTVRPAVEERLGGSSSWGMKMSEARIAFLRFIFEDVEQSSLQAVFLIFYEDAALTDKIWVSASIATSLLLSFTMVVQCLPEVRDWLWHRVFACFPFCRKFPIARIPWLVLALIFYRGLSTYPWISACSPTGDPCPEGRAWYEFWWGCDSNSRVTMLGLPARMEVVDEVMQTSQLGIGIILASVAFAGIVWYSNHQWARCARKIRLGQAASYAVSGRLAPGGTAHADEVLRPISDEDDDPWLEPARRVFTASVEAEAAVTDPAAKALHSHLRALVEGLDRAAFALSRSHFSGQIALPGARWLLAKRLTTQLSSIHEIADAAKMDGPSMAQVSLLCLEVNHAQKLAEVRSHVKTLLSTRGFVQSGSEEKAWRIVETKRVPPLKLLHWSRLEALGELPKFRSGGSGAVHVDDLLDQVASSLGVYRARAERHLVVFMLSHRWLRTKGHVHHPDSEDNVKAKKLVAFARWFRGMAASAGMSCEVAFWIDYCCCEQDDRFGVDVAIAALPLYIASCTKVIAWRTPDFDRRCWTMVERLLSYSFCRGGLTPYVIDETFEAPKLELQDSLDGLEARESDTRDVKWQVNLGGKEWIDFDDTSQVILKSAREAGVPSTVIETAGRRYEVNLITLEQRNDDTGFKRPVREIPLGERRPARRLTKRSSVSQLALLEESFMIHRTAKKLPDPLDPETCLLTRDSHRRQISHLVSVALAVPALEVFADRQPVEWGLTEVIEQSLGKRTALPDEFTWDERDDIPAPDSWLELDEAKDPGETKRKGFSVSHWRLVVVEPGARSAAASRQDADAMVWVDLGFKPDAVAPSPDEIDKLFRVVDGALDSGAVPKLVEPQIRALIMGLKADLRVALDRGNIEDLEQAVIRAREVELTEKRVASERICSQRLENSWSSGDESEMRGALRFARAQGAEALPIYKEVQVVQRRLYEEQLLSSLELSAADADIVGLAAVYKTAESHGLTALVQQVSEAAKAQVDRAKSLATEEAVSAVAFIQSTCRECGWKEVEQHAASALLRLTMELALVKAEATDNLGTLRAVEQRARRDGLRDLAERAEKLVSAAARRLGDRMGLPADWDVVERLAGTETARLLKKDEVAEIALLAHMQNLVNMTYYGWGGYGNRTRTRDRGHEPQPKELQVMSVVYVQNAEGFVNYRARRTQLAAALAGITDARVGDVWDVKTAKYPFVNVGRHKENPCDKQINEHYLWHGCTPAAATGITDTEFDMKRVGSAYGSLFGPGIYFAESCMKADEYTQSDDRGWMPLILSRVCLGNINYCDAPAPVAMSASLEASCKPAGGYHSILGDREKVVKTFREFIVFDNHQVYPEYIVWYKRVY